MIVEKLADSVYTKIVINKNIHNVNHIHFYLISYVIAALLSYTTLSSVYI